MANSPNADQPFIEWASVLVVRRFSAGCCARVAGEARIGRQDVSASRGVYQLLSTRTKDRQSPLPGLIRNNGRLQVGILIGFRMPREVSGQPNLGVLDLGAVLISGKGCQYRPISAATIKNTTHKNSKPRIHKLSR